MRREAMKHSGRNSMKKRKTTRVIVIKRRMTRMRRMRRMRRMKLKKTCFPEGRDKSQRGDDGLVRRRYHPLSSGFAEASENWTDIHFFH
jgi:hypothetical protein